MKESFEKQKDVFECLTLLECGENGRERYRIDPGVYQFDTGFRNFGEHENDWMSGSSDDVEDRLRPFRFDYGHPDVARLEQYTFSGTPNFIEILTRYEELIGSMNVNEEEYNTSLSDVVGSGSGMCAAKMTLLGALIKRNSDLEVQGISG